MRIYFGMQRFYWKRIPQKNKTLPREQIGGKYEKPGGGGAGICERKGRTVKGNQGQKAHLTNWPI
jgi:hypothetical protein